MDQTEDMTSTLKKSQDSLGGLNQSIVGPLFDVTKSQQVRLQEDQILKLKQIHMIQENQWKKTKAVLEQKIELLQMQIEELKQRQENQKQMYETLMNTLNDLSTTGQPGNKLFKQIQHTIELHTQQLIEQKNRNNETIKTLEIENRSLKDEINDLKLKMKDNQHFFEKQKALFDQKTLQHQAQKKRIVQQQNNNQEHIRGDIEEIVQAKITEYANQIQRLQDEHEKELALLQKESQREILEYQELFDKEKQALEARIQKGQNTIKKYQAYLELNCKSFTSLDISKMDLSQIKQDYNQREDVILEKKNQTQNQIYHQDHFRQSKLLDERSSTTSQFLEKEKLEKSYLLRKSVAESEKLRVSDNSAKKSSYVLNTEYHQDEEEVIRKSTHHDKSQQYFGIASNQLQEQPRALCRSFTSSRASNDKSIIESQESLNRSNLEGLRGSSPKDFGQINSRLIGQQQLGSNNKNEPITTSRRSENDQLPLPLNEFIEGKAQRNSEQHLNPSPQTNRSNQNIFNNSQRESSQVAFQKQNYLYGSKENINLKSGPLNPSRSQQHISDMNLSSSQSQIMGKTAQINQYHDEGKNNVFHNGFGPLSTINQNICNKSENYALRCSSGMKDGSAEKSFSQSNYLLSTPNTDQTETYGVKANSQTSPYRLENNGVGQKSGVNNSQVINTSASASLSNQSQILNSNGSGIMSGLSHSQPIKEETSAIKKIIQDLGSQECQIKDKLKFLENKLKFSENNNENLLREKERLNEQLKTVMQEISRLKMNNEINDEEQEACTTELKNEIKFLINKLLQAKGQLSDTQKNQNGYQNQDEYSQSPQTQAINQYNVNCHQPTQQQQQHQHQQNIQNNFYVSNTKGNQSMNQEDGRESYLNNTSQDYQSMPKKQGRVEYSNFTIKNSAFEFQNEDFAQQMQGASYFKPNKSNYEDRRDYRDLQPTQESEYD